MRVQVTESTIKLWASAADTYRWAHRPGRSWPCSTLAGRRFFAEFDRSGLVDLTINGRIDTDDVGVDGTEFSAIAADLLEMSEDVPDDHPARFCAIDQHLEVR